MPEEIRDLSRQRAALLRRIDDLHSRTRFLTSRRCREDVVTLAKEILGESDDLVTRTIRLPGIGKITLIYFDGMVARHEIEDAVLEPLTRLPAAFLPARSVFGAAKPGLPPAGSGLPSEGPGSSSRRAPGDQGTGGGSVPIQVLGDVIESAARIEEVDTPGPMLDALLHGQALLAADGFKGALKLDFHQPKERGVDEPLLEIVVRGPRDAFTESAATNISLIRRRIKDPNFRAVKKSVGRRSRTDLFVLYLDDVVNRSLIEEFFKRIGHIDIDGLVDSGQLEQMFEDVWWTPFPQTQATERPDAAVAAILEGRFVLVTDTTPMALIIPASFDTLLKAPEDYYDRPATVGILRMVRFTATFLGLALPSLYVALVSYHPSLLPTRLALRLAEAREGVAFPVVFEALLMQLFLEIIREAGLRAPGPIGQTFGVVGGIVLGEMGVRAGIVSEAMVVIIALSGLSTFAVPTIELGTSIRLLGLPLLLGASVFGLLGIVFFSMVVLIHMAALKPMGIPYLVPFVYYPLSDWKDVILKMPWPTFRLRPSFYGPQQRIRMQDRRKDVFAPASGHSHADPGGPAAQRWALREGKAGSGQGDGPPLPPGDKNGDAGG